MFCFLLHLAVFSMLAGKNAFPSSGMMNITSCPITYYGQKYDKVYVSDTDFCFNGLYTPGIKNDCILMSGGTADRGDLAVLTREIPTGSGVHQLLPNLKHAGKCVNIIPLKDSQQSEVSFSFILVNSLDVCYHLSEYILTFNTAQTNKGVITDMSGCRLSGVVYKTNTTAKDPNICSTVTCDVSGVATAVSDCGPMERCQGNGSCILNTVCTVAGSIVIDFIGRVHSVPDSCGYTLLKPSLIPGFQVFGVFQERRRRDVSFVDRVILQLDGKGLQISLEQGRRVQLNNTVLTLTATAQVVHGVELSKDRTGVTAKISASNYTVSVHFDSDTALIHMTRPSGAPVHGLCGNSSRTLSKDRVSDHSSTDCQTKYDDADDNTINCNAICILVEYPCTILYMYNALVLYYICTVPLYYTAYVQCPCTKLYMSPGQLFLLHSANNSQIIYKNTIMTQNISMLGPITRHGPVHIDFSCYYSHPDLETISFPFSSVNREIASGEYIYNLTMKAYTSADRLKAIESSTDIELNEQLWVELKTDGLDEKMVAVVTDSCWATNQPSPTGSLRYDLIINGCPNPTDETVKMEENGLGTSNYFSFNMFQFTGKTGDVYLHCKVVLCFRQGNTCTPSCSQGERRRRSTMPKYEDKYPAFIIMAWTS
uniref:ZP domain-containing protein n=1 Tax=Amphiprion percula TaxID=161767 RepID=A0A3P8T4G9_AMPPE